MIQVEAKQSLYSELEMIGFLPGNTIYSTTEVMCVTTRWGETSAHPIPYPLQDSTTMIYKHPENSQSFLLRDLRTNTQCSSLPGYQLEAISALRESIRDLEFSKIAKAIIKFRSKNPYWS